MNNLNRQLGLVEHLFANLHSLGAMLYVNVVRVQGEISPNLLRIAINLLQKQHPILRTHLQQQKDRFYFSSQDTLPIPLQVISLTQKQQWLEIAQKELLKRFPDSLEPLCRIILLQKMDDVDSGLIVTFHHAIADGISVVNLLDELLDYYYQLSINSSLPSMATLATLPPLERLLEKCLTDHADLSSANLSPSAPPNVDSLIIEATVPSAHRKTILMPYVLDETLMQCLKERCLQEKTTVHGALCASMLMAVSTQMTLDDISLSCSSSINLRASCYPSVKMNQLGSLISSITINQTLRTGMNFWMIAREYRENLQQTIVAKIPHLQVTNPEILKRYTIPFLSQMADYNMGRNATTHVSNLGRFISRYERPKFKLKEFYFATGLQIVGPCFWLGSVTIDGSMYCTFTYVSPLMKQSTAKLLADKVVRTLKEAISRQ